MNRPDIRGGPTVVLALLVLAMIGLYAVQYRSAQDFQDSIYDRCVQREVFDMRATEYRKVQVAAFREFARFESVNVDVDPQLRALRVKSYTDMANAGDKAIAATVTIPCAVFK